MNLLAVCKVDEIHEIRRVVLHQNLQADLQNIFSEQEQQFVAGRDRETTFDGEWTPDDDELLVLENLPLANLMVEATARVAELNQVSATEFLNHNITALFWFFGEGDERRLTVQRFIASQVFDHGKWAIVRRDNRFERLTDPLFVLGNKLTCVIEGGNIKFQSYSNLRMIFDIEQFFREATDQDIGGFFQHTSIAVENEDWFRQHSNQTIRKLVHKIQSSDVLNNYTPQQIQQRAAASDLQLTLNDNGEIEIPEDKNHLRLLLRFLDEGVYKSSLSGRQFETNSKKRVG